MTMSGRHSIENSRRGEVALMVVLVTSLVVGTFVVAAGARLIPARAELVRTRASDQAFALAEAGVALARAQLTRDPAYAGCSGLKLGRGTIDVEIELEDGAFVVRSKGVVKPRLARPGVRVTRRVEATLRAAEGGALAIVTWRER